MSRPGVAVMSASPDRGWDGVASTTWIVSEWNWRRAIRRASAAPMAFINFLRLFSTWARESQSTNPRFRTFSLRIGGPLRVSSLEPPRRVLKPCASQFWAANELACSMASEPTWRIRQPCDLPGCALAAFFVGGADLVDFFVRAVIFVPDIGRFDWISIDRLRFKD